MATPTEQATDLITQVQDAGLKLAGSVAESWAAVLRGVPGLPGALGAGDQYRTGPAGEVAAHLPQSAGEAVDRFYDTGVQILEAQRAAAHHVLDAVVPTLRSATVVTPPAARG
jgi:hypothetical protein